MSTKKAIPATFRVVYGFVVDQIRHSLQQSIEYDYQKVSDLSDKSEISAGRLEQFLVGTISLTVAELKRLVKAYSSHDAELWVTVPIDLVDPAHVFDEPYYRVPPVEED
jgi:hypothetical protein